MPRARGLDETWSRAARTLALVVALTGSCASLVVWQATDRRAFVGDEAHFAGQARGFAEAFRDRDWARVLRSGDPHPPLVPWIGAAVSLLAGDGGLRAALRGLSLAWFLLGLAGLWRLARRIMPDGCGPALAILGWSAISAVQSDAPIFTLDHPLAVACVWALDALLRSDGFRSRGASIAAGVLSGIALMTKWTAAVFIVLPAVAILAPALRGHRGFRPIGHAALAATIAASIAAPWYAVNLDVLGSYASDMGAGDRHAMWVRDAGAGWHLRTLATASMGCVLLVPALIRAVVCLRPGHPLQPLAVQALGALAVFSALPFKEAQYLLPAMPAMVILAVSSAAALPRRLRPLAAGAASAVLGLQIVHTSGLVMPDAPVPGSTAHSWFGAPRFIERSDGGIGRFLALAEVAGAGSEARFFVAPLTQDLEPARLRGLAMLRGRRWSFTTPGPDVALPGDVSAPLRGQAGLLDADWVIVSGHPSGHNAWRKALRESLAAEITNLHLQDPLDPTASSLEPVASIRLDDGRLLELLRCPARWPETAILPYSDFLWEHWPGRGAWASVLARARPDKTGEPSWPALVEALDSGDGERLERALDRPGLAERLPGSRAADLRALALARRGRAREAAALLAGRPDVNPWIRIGILAAAGDRESARGLARQLVVDRPDDLQASVFLWSSWDYAEALRTVPPAALPFLAAPVASEGWLPLVEAGFAAFRAGAWRRGLLALRTASASSAGADALIRDRLGREIPDSFLLRDLLASPDLRKGLADALLTLDRLTSGR